MTILHSFDGLPQTGAAVALGNFDGVHLGHQQVLKAAASQNGLIPAALLFQDHPALTLGKRPPERLLDKKQKMELFEKLGIAYTCAVPFSELRSLSGREFVRDVLVKRMNAKALFCGFNYRCGANASCNTHELKELCEEYAVRLTVLPELDFDGEPVSSTRIRMAIQAGNVEEANQMLGRPFTYAFEVVSGDRRGRLLNFPTINQFFPTDFVQPRFGVYASRAWVNGAWMPSVSNFGSRPTFQGESVRSETCILGFRGDLYGMHVPVSLLHFLRPEQKFPSVQALKAQMELDSKRAMELFQGGER